MEPGKGSGRIMPIGIRQHGKASVAVEKWCEINKKVRVQRAIVTFSEHLTLHNFFVRLFQPAAPERPFRVTGRRPAGESSLTVAD